MEWVLLETLEPRGHLPQLKKFKFKLICKNGIIFTRE